MNATTKIDTAVSNNTTNDISKNLGKFIRKAQLNVLKILLQNYNIIIYSNNILKLFAHYYSHINKKTRGFNLMKPRIFCLCLRQQ